MNLMTEPEKDSSLWIAEVSHELRLPIANLKLLIETLLDGAKDDPETLERMLQRARQEIERLNKLVLNLLSIETVAQGRGEIARQWNSLWERANYVVESTQKLALVKGINVQNEVAADWCIYANPQQLDQVLLNLVENAIKFTLPGGIVRICCGGVPGSFKVIDTGIGMPVQEIPRIFERFYRIDRAQSRGSTGLGLSIVKHIVDLHGAKIDVTSEEGSGSTFSLEFPGPI